MPTADSIPADARTPITLPKRPAETFTGDKFRYGRNGDTDRSHENTQRRKPNKSVGRKGGKIGWSSTQRSTIHLQKYCSGLCRERGWWREQERCIVVIIETLPYLSHDPPASSHVPQSIGWLASGTVSARTIPPSALLPPSEAAAAPPASPGQRTPTS